MKIKYWLIGVLFLWMLLFSFESMGQGISGSVSVNSTAQSNVTVQVYSVDDPWNVVTQGISGFDGSYSISGISTGSYKVFFDAAAVGGWNEWYGDKPYFKLASTVLVTNGVTTGIDIDLDPAGRISGTVLNSNGVGIAGVTVALYTVGGWNALVNTDTDSNGDYIIGDLPTGSYRLEFNGYAVNYQPVKLAGPFAVTNGYNTTITNVVMKQGGAISGQITDSSTSAVLENVSVQGFNSSLGVLVYVRTDSLGNYYLGGLTGGQWTVSFNGADIGYGTANLNGGNALTVTEGSTISGQNQSLSKSGAIAGRVTTESGVGILGITVEIYESGYSWSSSSTTTDDDGDYVLIAYGGSYDLKFSDAEQNFGNEWWNDTTNRSSATSVTVVDGVHTQGFDAVLAENDDGYTLWGRITEKDANDTSISAAFLTLSDGVDSLQVSSDLQGFYIYSGLASNSYSLSVEPPANSKYTVTNLTITLTSSVSVVQRDIEMAVGGTIKGRVLDENAGGISGINVSALVDGASDPGWSQYSANSDDDGYYVIQGLPAGDYKVKFEDWSGTYKTEYYNDITNWTSATVQTVALGTIYTLSDAVLSTGPAITGRVTNNVTGDPVAGVYVYYYDQYDSQSWGDRITDTNGEYRWTGLAAGDYRIQFQAKNAGYYNQFYDNKPDLSSATTVTLGNDNDVTGIDAGLIPGATISGTITNSIGNPLSGVTVDVYSSLNSLNPQRSATTDATGQYSVKIFSDDATQYKVKFSKYGYVIQWYNDKTDFNTADLVPSTALTNNSSQAITGIDACLEEAGVISGKIMDNSDSSSLGWVNVYAYPAGQGWGYVESTTSDGYGNYALSHLTNGSYDIYFSITDYVPQWYHGVAAQSNAISITVTQGSTVTLTDERLKMYGSVAGTVTDDTTGNPIENAYVRIYREGNASYTASGWTDANGEYMFSNIIPTNDYQVLFTATGYADQWYSEKATRATADLLNVGSGNTTVGVDASLFQRGSISGTVSNDVSGVPIENVAVTLYSTNGTSIETKMTNPQGGYLFGNLASNSYLVKFEHSEYITEWFDDKSNQVSATAIAVSGTGVSTANAGLQNIGQISGQVTAADTGNGLSGISVSVYNAGGYYVHGIMTDANGNYAIGGLATGAYKVYFYTPVTSDYQSEWYNGKATQATADSVVITNVGDTVSGIDAALARGGTVNGTITDASDSQPILSVAVTLYSVSTGGVETAVRTVYTDANGDYQLTGIAGGNYIIRTVHNSYLSGNSGTFTVTPPGTVTKDLSLDLGTSISGAVTNVTTMTPMNGVMVTLCTASNAYVKSAFTDTNGQYTILGVAAGEYIVKFEKIGYLTQWYSNQSEWAAANIITATPPAVVSNINAILLLGGTVTGVVSDVTTALPISGASMTIYSSTTGTVVGTVDTDANGVYSFNALLAGNYYVKADKNSYVASNSAVFAVTPPGTVTQNMALTPATVISGKVTDSAGTSGLAGVQVNLYSDAGAYMGTTTTDASGNYSLDNIGAGSYKVGFFKTDYFSQWYDNKNSLSNATIITAVPPAAITNINAVMVRGAVLSGTVSNSVSGVPLDSVSVDLFDAATNLVASVITDGNGDYRINNVTSGSYKMKFSRYAYIEQWYRQAADFNSATSIVVTTGTDIAGLDAALVHMGAISGKVTDSGSSALSGFEVELYDASGSKVAGQFTDAGGNYSFDPVANGSYKIHVPAVGTQYLDQWYDGKTDITNANVITVTGPNVTSGIDIAMQDGASIAGTIYRVNSGGITTVVTNAFIRLYNTNDMGVLYRYENDATNGVYSFAGLPQGGYKIYVTAPEVLSRWYSNALDSADADTLVMVPPAGMTGIDVVLPEPGQITGRVVDSVNLSVGISNVTVYAYASSGWTAGSAVTDSNGYYTVAGLENDNYTVKFDGGAAGYFSQYYDGKVETNATVIPLTAPEVVTLNDALLVKSGSISGRVTDTQGTPISNVLMHAYFNYSQVGWGTRTDTNGDYCLTLLETGDYTVKAQPFTDEYLATIYTNMPSFTGATQVPVVLGSNTPDINFQLYQSSVVSGVVSNIDSDMIENLYIYLHDVTEPNSACLAYTDSNGAYAFRNIWPGTYKLEFDGPNRGYIKQWYDNKTNENSATEIVLQEGTQFTANQVLIRAGVISGTVMSKQTAFTSAAPLQGIVVRVTRASDGSFVKEATTASDGSYAVTDPSMVTGNYIVRFYGHPSGTLHKFFDQWYPEKRTEAEAVPVAVVNEQTTFGIDAHLYRPTVTATVVSGNGTVSPTVQEIDYYGSGIITLTPVPYWSPSLVMDSRYSYSRDLSSYDYNAYSVDDDIQLDVTYTQIPDLMVEDSIAMPTNAFNGENIVVTWTVTNNGLADAIGPWSDRVWLSDDDQFGDDVWLANFTFEGTLSSHQSVTRIQQVTIPKSVTNAGLYHIIIESDKSGNIYEGRAFELGETNNVTVSTNLLALSIAPTPDLVVSNVIAPQNAFSGQEIAVDWTILNQGDGGTTVPVWYDRIYLSVDDVFDGSDILLAKYIRNKTFLPVGESYNSSETVTLPNGISGNYYIMVQADGSESIDEAVETNNVSSAMFAVTLTPPPDLQVTAINVPANGFSGQKANISYTVQNLGSGRTVASHWWDNVYLSTNNDSAISSSDIYLGYYYHDGELLSSESYSYNIAPQLPVGINGTYYIKVWTDQGNRVFEHTYVNNNISASAAMPVILQGPDLEVNSFNIDSSAPFLSGHPLHLSWQVKNFGTAATHDSYWNDAVYLFSNAVFDVASAIKLGEPQHTGIIDVGVNYTISQDFDIPVGLSGSYKLVVMTDSRARVFELNDTNNLSVVLPITLESKPADLTLTEVSGPTNANSGDAIQVSWIVKNQGIGSTYPESWVDNMLLTTDPTFHDQGVLLGSFVHNGELDINESCTNNNMVVLPANITSGTYYLFALADVDHAVYEESASNYSNNLSTGAMIEVTHVVADLAVTNTVVPTSVDSGSNVVIRWSVENIGAGRTSSDYWYDRIVISPVTDFNDAQTIYLKSYCHEGALATGESSTGEVECTVPRDMSGTNYIGIIDDAYNYVLEDNKTNNIIWLPIMVNFVPAPDLRVSNIVAPSSAYSGSDIDVSWTINNDDVDTDKTWYDRIYLSRDRIFDAGDIQLAYKWHSGGLTSGGSYSVTQSCRIPDGISGPMYVFVVCDRRNYIYEAGRKENNTLYRIEPLMVELPEPGDLVVSNIQSTNAVMLGDEITVTYDVSNQGQNTTPSWWIDGVYLSQTSNLTEDAVLLGEVSHGNALAQGDSENMSLTAKVPGILPGIYFVIARADIRNQVLEDNETNNTTVALQAVTVDVNELLVGQSEQFALDNEESVYYKLNITNAGDAVMISVVGTNKSAFNELYAAYDRMPSRSSFDFIYQHPFESDQEIIIPVSRQGTYYIMAYGNGSPAGNAVTLRADVIPFSVLAVDPVAVGNAGTSTFKISGARFTVNTAFALKSGGTAIAATNSYYRSTGLAYASFELTGVAIGDYDMEASTPAGAIAVMTNAVTVQSGSGPDIQASINGPASVRPARDYVFYVNYANLGDADGAPPILVVRTTTETPFGASLANLSTNPVQIFAGSTEGVAGILRPGEKHNFPLYFHPNSWEVNFTVNVITEDDTTPIDWDELEPSVRPASMSDAEWAVLWPRIKNRIGPAWGDYVRALSEIATLLSGRGEEAWDVNVLFEELLNQEAGYGTSQVSGMLINALTGQQLRGVTVSALAGDLTNTNITDMYVNQAETDISGEFAINGLPEGTYSLHVEGYVFTNDVDVTVSPGVDIHGLVLNAYPAPDDSPDMTVQYNDYGADIAVDDDGVTHIVWLRDGNVWHARLDNGSWVDAQSITDTTNTNAENNIAGLRLKASDVLFDGTDAGLIASWTCGTGNLARICHSVGRKETSGSSYEWSVPETLVDQPYHDSNPDMTIMPSGKVLVVFQRRNASVTDDNDIYYGIYNITSAGINWQTPSSVGVFDVNGNMIPLDGSAGTAFEFQLRGSTGKLPGRIPLIGGKEAKFATSFQGALQGGCELSGSFSGIMAMTLFDYLDLKLTNTGNIGYKIKCPQKVWQFKAATLTTTGSAEGFIPVGVWEIPGDGWFVDKILEIKIGPTVGIALSGTSGWVGGSFPSWPNAGNISMAVSLGGKGEVAILDESAKGTVTLNATVNGDLMPERKITGTSLALTGELESGSYKKSLNATWSWEPKDGWFGFGGSSVNSVYEQNAVNDYGTSNQVDSIQTIDYEGGTLTINIPDPVLTWSPLVGQGSDYSMAEVDAVLGTGVTSRVREDKYPALAQDSSGNIFMAWAQDTDPNTAGQDGGYVVAATFDAVAETWNSPATIPGSLGYNSGVKAAYYGSTPVVVWSHIDTTGLDSSATIDELDAHLATNIIMYSTYNGSAWTTAAGLYTVGRNSSLEVKKVADGRVLAVWLNRQPGADTRQLMVSFWNGTAWTTPEVIASGNLREKPSIGIVGHDPMVMWSVDTDTNQNSTVLRMQSRVRQTNVWQATVDFSASLYTTNSTTEYEVNSFAGSIPLPPPSFNCCPDDNDDDDDKPKPEPKPEPNPGSNNDGFYSPVVERPRDPNDIVGPAGFGPDAWVRADKPLAYTIRFENDPEWATAPAQEVVITQKLDSALDPRTFRVGSFGWGNLTFTPDESRAFYSKRIDLRDDYGYYVDVVAFVDSSTGVAKWQITTIDPVTGQKPIDPQMGFLQPNNTNGIGEGFVTYTISPKSMASPGETVNAEATIVFDTESPLATPAIYNTLDTAAPDCTMSNLSAYTAQPVFDVQWSGSDDTNGSGIASYSVYVSTNGTDYAVWLKDTELTSAPFSGVQGVHYRFYAVAKDNTGQESARTAASEADTIAGPQQFTLIYIASAGGSINGATSQVVNINGNASPVTAVPDPQYVFRRWNDGVTSAARSDTGITGALSVMAIFDPEHTVGGVPSSWYSKYGIGPGANEYWTPEQWNALDALDTDGDNVEAWKEYIADTDPTNSASYFHVKAMDAGGTTTLYFDSSSNRFYTLLGCPDLTDGFWTNVPGIGPRRGLGGTDIMQDTNVPVKGPFYRLKVQLP